MKHCEQCGGGCKGCGRQLELSEPEVHILKTLGQIPFLPVARRSDDDMPVYLEDDMYSTDTCSLALACLEKKLLVELDYHTPLKGFDYSAYGACPLRGSIALTARGQQVLQLMELEGIRED